MAELIKLGEEDQLFQIQRKIKTKHYKGAFKKIKKMCYRPDLKYLHQIMENHFFTNGQIKQFLKSLNITEKEKFLKYFDPKINLHYEQKNNIIRPNARISKKCLCCNRR